jgi:hypothetical protein
MAALFKRTSVAVPACILAMVAIGGFAAGFNARAGFSALGLSASGLAEMSASDTISLRFPNDWTEAAATPPMRLAFASADATLTLLDPTPIYPLETEITSAASVEALPEGPSPAVQPAASAPAKPAIAAARGSAHRSNAVLNDSQIASIKRRLNLTPDQARYWPAVEVELRKMEYKKDQKGTRTAAVDMSKVNVEGLKSAGFPLVMSFNDDQRRELNSLAHLLGLESVMSSF